MAEHRIDETRHEQIRVALKKLDQPTVRIDPAPFRPGDHARRRQRAGAVVPGVRGGTAGALALLALLVYLLIAGGEEQEQAADPDDRSSGRSRAPARAAVLRVVDGDTIEVELDGVEEDVRYIGVDTPETVKPGEPVLNKTTMSAFHSSGFERLLRAWGVELLLFTGISTNSCVQGTARDAADRGFSCVLVEDACGAASQALHDAACTNFARLLGRVASTTEVLRELETADDGQAMSPTTRTRTRSELPGR